MGSREPNMVIGTRSGPRLARRQLAALVAMALAAGCGAPNGSGIESKGPNAAPEAGAPAAALARRVLVTRFEPLTELKDGELTLALDTDLPDSASVMWNAYRPYVRQLRGEEIEYGVEFGSGKTTVGELKNGLRIDVSDATFKRLFDGQREHALARQETFKIIAVGKEVMLRLTVPIHQDAPFAKLNENLEGSMVIEKEFPGLGTGRLINWSKPVKHGRSRLMAASSAPTPVALFPGVDASLLARLVVQSMPTPITRAIADPDFHEKLLPLAATGSLPNDRGQRCDFHQYTLNGVRYFHDLSPDVDEFPIGVIVFDDSKCMRGVAINGDQSLNAETINRFVAKQWFDKPDQARVAVNSLLMPDDASLHGLCMVPAPGASVTVLLQYVVEDDSIVAVLQSDSGGTCR
jgi:hypothetical protein